jgi:hypothetical protein
MEEEKIGRGLGSRAEPLVGVKGAKLPVKVTLYSRIIQ